MMNLSIAPHATVAPGDFGWLNLTKISLGIGDPNAQCWRKPFGTSTRKKTSLLNREDPTTKTIPCRHQYSSRVPPRIKYQLYLCERLAKRWWMVPGGHVRFRDNRFLSFSWFGQISDRIYHDWIHLWYHEVCRSFFMVIRSHTMMKIPVAPHISRTPTSTVAYRMLVFARRCSLRVTLLLSGAVREDDEEMNIAFF